MGLMEWQEILFAEYNYEEEMISQKMRQKCRETVHGSVKKSLVFRRALFCSGAQNPVKWTQF